MSVDRLAEGEMKLGNREDPVCTGIAERRRGGGGGGGGGAVVCSQTIC